MMIPQQPEQQEGRVLWAVGSRPREGQDTAYHEWYDLTLKTLFGYSGVRRVTLNRSYRGIGDNAMKSPDYVATYEFPDKETLAAMLGSPEFAENSVSYEEQGRYLVETLWSGWYIAVQTIDGLADASGTPRYLDVVGAVPKPGREAAFNEWYDEHVTLRSRYEGMVTVVRWRSFWLSGGEDVRQPNHLMVYEFADKAAADAFYTSPVAKEASASWIERGRHETDILWASLYEPLVTLER